MASKSDEDTMAQISMCAIRAHLRHLSIEKADAIRLILDNKEFYLSTVKEREDGEDEST